MSRSLFLGTIAAIGLAGCQAGQPVPDVSRQSAPGALRAAAPPGAPPGTCWSRDVTPAMIETVTEQILLQPAELSDDGTVRAPAIYKTETRQQILRERRELWFQTPCPETVDATFIASLQRALRARQVYWGPVSGQMDLLTRRAVRRYQAQQGLDSAVLSIAAARQLGLVAYPRKDTEG